MEGWTLEDISQARQTVGDLLASQRSAVLATQNHGQPYCSLMAFAATADLRHFILVTRRATGKYANLIAEPRVGLLVDNRANQAADTQEALAVTVMGAAAEVEPGARDRWAEVFLAKHPHLEDFVRSPDAAVVKIRVEKYYLVRRFQEVVEIAIT
jgi:nitroimidazol reductase NimA-like FMN-containing flavoprotein (pyridoxamine 5'-phosphate oxidase superfamily)